MYINSKMKYQHYPNFPPFGAVWHFNQVGQTWVLQHGMLKGYAKSQIYLIKTLWWVLMIWNGNLTFQLNISLSLFKSEICFRSKVSNTTYSPLLEDWAINYHLKKGLLSRFYNIIKVSSQTFSENKRMAMKIWIAIYQ